MRTLHSVWLDGQALQDVDDRLYIVDIIESTPMLQIESAPQTGIDGSRMLSRFRRETEVTVFFLIRRRDPAKRREIMDDVLIWCGDGELSISSRPGQYANAKITSYPAIDSSADWTQTLQMTFTVFGGYWLSDTPQTASLAYEHDPEPETIGAAEEKELTLYPSGTADTCYLEFQITNDDPADDMDDIIIAVGDYSFTFADLGLGAGDTLECTYDANGFLTLTIDGTSVLAYRTGDDDIILAQRESNTVGVKTIKAATVTVTARGRWM